MERNGLGSTVRTALLLSTIVFLPLIIFISMKLSGLDRMSFSEICFGPSENFTADCRPYIGILWLSIISLCCGMTTIGMIMSITIRREQNIFLFGNTLWEIVLFSAFGVIIGLMTLCLFIGGFLSGELFPSLLPSPQSSYVEVSIRPIDWAKLALWSFIFGFSERLFPSIADTLTSQVSKEVRNFPTKAE